MSHGIQIRIFKATDTLHIAFHCSVDFIIRVLKLQTKPLNTKSGFSFKIQIRNYVYGSLKKCKGINQFI